MRCGSRRISTGGAPDSTTGTGCRPDRIPYELEARHGEKRGHPWIGYKTHVTESCEAALPELITQVETTIATAGDVEQLTNMQQGLARNDLLPATHLVEGGSVRGRNLVTSRQTYAIDLIGPVPADHNWQAKAGQGYDARAPAAHPSLQARPRRNWPTVSRGVCKSVDGEATV